MPPAPSTMRRDLISAYAASGAKVAGWAIVSAVLYRRAGADGLGLFALIRATLGVLSYTSLGLAPAMLRAMVSTEKPSAAQDQTSRILNYESGDSVLPRDVYSNGVIVGLSAGFVASLIVLAYAAAFPWLHDSPALLQSSGSQLVLLLGIGVVLRMVSEVPAAVLQARDRIALDNQLLAGADIGWALIPLAANVGNELFLAGFGFLVANGLLLLARSLNAARLMNLWVPEFKSFDGKIAWSLLSFGLLVVLAQAADFLYAPIDYILINHFLGTVTVAIYTPAVQIDSALLLLVGGLASVLLPKTAMAHGAGEIARVRSFYLVGTTFSIFTLLVAAFVIWTLSPIIFRSWLDDPMPATQAILPLILIHTIVGGSSAVGRAILLGMGKVKPFAASVLIAGVCNVILSFVFVKYLDLGLRGIIYGTIISVVGRCAIWMPWYVLRTIRRESAISNPSLAASP